MVGSEGFDFVPKALRFVREIMSDVDKNQLATSDQPSASARRPYRKPMLQVYGSIQDLTRTGAAGSKKEPGFPVRTKP